jgi:TPR repeat protein
VKQSYTEAIKWLKKAAEQGDAEAQYNLGFCYGNGEGVEKSFTEAVKWYKKAAEQGHEEAIEVLKTIGF